MLEHQRVIQAQNTAQAREALKDGDDTMKELENERKEVSQQWREGVAEIRQRDQALSAVRAALREEEANLVALQHQVTAAKAAAEAEGERREQLKSRFGKGESGAKFQKRKAEALAKQREAITAELVKYKKEETAKEKGIKETTLRTADVANQTKLLEKSIQKELEELRRAETETIEAMEKQKNSDKFANTVRKGVYEKDEERRKAEMQLEKLRNQLERVRRTTLEAQQRQQSLATETALLTQNNDELEKEAEQVEAEIQRGHLAMAKQQLQMDRLNKDIDEKRRHHVDEHTGPLEARIKHLRQQSREHEKAIDELQREWLKKQATLLQTHDDLDKDFQKMKTTNDQLVVLKQKKLRLEGIAAQAREDEAATLREVREMQRDMQRLNAAILALADKEQRMLTEAERLKAKAETNEYNAEQQLEEIQSKIKAVTEEKNELEQELIEAERQMLLWERKMDLEKQMQEALDDVGGTTEAQEVRRDITRLEAALEQLRKKEDNLNRDMEIMVNKRDDVQRIEDKAAKSDPNRRLAGTKAAVARQLASIRKTAKQLKETRDSLRSALAKKKEDLEELRRAVADRQEEVSALRSSIDGLARTVTAHKIVRQRHNADISALQRTAKLLQQQYISADPAKPPPKQAASAKQQAALQAACQGAMSRVNVLVDSVRELAPELREHPSCRAAADELEAWSGCLVQKPLKQLQQQQQQQSVSQ
eukprot:GHVU01093421.1.p1 GENE.GHVU01093421.1~~GHVU01093421.1.p1  ORF type:complete len:711 (+),score=273.16 GHVU01093421.1:3-2135(+)